MFAEQVMHGTEQARIEEGGSMVLVLVAQRTHR